MCLNLLLLMFLFHTLVHHYLFVTHHGQALLSISYCCNVDLYWTIIVSNLCYCFIIKVVRQRIYKSCSVLQSLDRSASDHKTLIRNIVQM